MSWTSCVVLLLQGLPRTTCTWPPVGNLAAGCELDCSHSLEPALGMVLSTFTTPALPSLSLALATCAYSCLRVLPWV